MAKNTEPTPTARRDEDFPKTTTIPDGWVTDCLMEKYNQTGMAFDRGVTEVKAQDTMPVPTTGGHTNGRTNGKTHDEPAAAPAEDQESPFARRLDPFPAAWDVPGMWL